MASQYRASGRTRAKGKNKPSVRLRARMRDYDDMIRRNREMEKAYTAPGSIKKVY